MTIDNLSAILHANNDLSVYKKDSQAIFNSSFIVKLLLHLQ